MVRYFFYAQESPALSVGIVRPHGTSYLRLYFSESIIDIIRTRSSKQDSRMFGGSTAAAAEQYSDQMQLAVAVPVQLMIVLLWTLRVSVNYKPDTNP